MLRISSPMMMLPLSFGSPSFWPWCAKCALLRLSSTDVRRWRRFRRWAAQALVSTHLNEETPKPNPLCDPTLARSRKGLSRLACQYFMVKFQLFPITRSHKEGSAWYAKQHPGQGTPQQVCADRGVEFEQFPQAMNEMDWNNEVRPAENFRRTPKQTGATPPLR